MSFLDVRAKKGIFSKSLTDKLTPYLKDKTLAVDSIDVPEGNCQIQIRIEDHQGHATIETYRLVVHKTE